MPSVEMRDVLLVAAGFAAGLAVSTAFAKPRGKTTKGRTAKGNPKAARRFGGLIKLKPEMYDQYTQLHDHTWDEVMEKMYHANMRNFVVYLHEETHQMFSHWEYIGDNLEEDMKKLETDPMIKYWWSFCEPCQEPLKWSGPPPSQGGKGDWWSPLKCINSCGAWSIAWADEYPDPDFTPCNPHGKTSTSSSPPAKRCETCLTPIASHLCRNA
eukprot:Sspe_Gene.53900::Locus_29772_Transcript_1_1_Confidence_1.000_Length_737::g.53900::m.53900